MARDVVIVSLGPLLAPGTERIFRQWAKHKEAPGPTGREGMEPELIGREREVPEPTTRERTPSRHCFHPKPDLGPQYYTH